MKVYIQEPVSAYTVFIAVLAYYDPDDIALLNEGQYIHKKMVPIIANKLEL